MKLLLGASLLALAVPAAAQPAQAPPPPSELPPAQVEITAAQRHLMDTYGIPADEAAERLSLEETIGGLAQSLTQDQPDQFGGLWIEHEPQYRIKVAFKDPALRKDFRSGVDPSLRRFIQVVPTKYSVNERNALIDGIIAALDSAGILYEAYYEHRTDDLVIVTAGEEKVGEIRRLLPPRLQDFVKVRRGNVPVPTATSGVQAGDGVWAGWWSNREKNDYTHGCSFAFAARDSQNRLGILTAGHCDDTGFIKYQAPDHWVTISSPSFDWNQPNTKYDYQFFLLGSLSSSGYVFYSNDSKKIWARDIYATTPSYQSSSSRNVISGYPSEGYFRVVGTYGYYSQVVGDVICKSGHSTGLTCGEIVHGYYTYNGAKGWIKTGKSAQYIYATWGDSGGAVFTRPTSSSTVKAAGIVTAADIYDPTPDYDLSNNGGAYEYTGDEKPCLSDMENNSSYKIAGATGPAITDCTMIHMPIDYIDDQQMLTIVSTAP